MIQINRYAIRKEGRGVCIIDRLNSSIAICVFETENKKLNIRLAEYCLKIIEEESK